MEVTEGRILELENLLDFQNAKIGKLEYRIERLERLVAVLMEANKITGGETKSATLNCADLGTARAITTGDGSLRIHAVGGGVES